MYTVISIPWHGKMLKLSVEKANDVKENGKRVDHRRN